MRSLQSRRFIWCVVFLTGLAAFAFLGGCGSDGDDDQAVDEPEVVAPVPEPEVPTVTVADVVMNNAAIAFAGYNDALDTAMELQEEIEHLLSHPTMGSLYDARTAWLQAREAYQPTEVYRFRLGPIDALNDDGEIGDDGDGPEGRINGWPLGEALIDYVAPAVDGDDGPESSASVEGIMGNIIADRMNTADPITKEWLNDNNEFGDDERNVITGYHAIEFLLWGQDLNADGSGSGPRDATAGSRPVSDYYQNSDHGMCTSGPETNQDHSICMRRAEYLQAVTELLLDHLMLLVDAWNPAGNDSGVVDYHAWFTDPSPGRASLALSKILEGMGRMSFGELAGERINIALLLNSQEDEHSCFSDNTHRDIFLNVVGLQNMYLGEYGNQEALFGFESRMLSGHGVDDLLTEAGRSDLAEQLRMLVADAVSKAKVISDLAEGGMPFDQQIGDRNDPEINALTSALNAIIDPLEEAIRVLGVTTGDLLQDTCEIIDGRRGTGC